MMVHYLGATTLALDNIQFHKHVKYVLKIYREIWKCESGKVWTYEIEHV